MFCGQCGTPNKDDARFCANCGAPLKTVSVPAMEQTETPVAETPVVEAPVAEAPVVEAPVAEAPVVEAPVAEAPVMETPVAEAPVVETPVVEIPAAEAPVYETPVYETPAPVQEAPVTSDETVTFISQEMPQNQNVDLNPVQMPMGQPMQNPQFNGQPMGQPMQNPQFNGQPMGQPMQNPQFNGQPMGQPMPGQPMGQNVKPEKVKKEKAPKAPKEKKGHKGLIIGLIAAVVVLGGAAAAYWFLPLNLHWPLSKLTRTLESGKEALNKGDYDTAIEDCKEVIEIDPACYEAYAGAIYAYEYKNDTKGMEEVYGQFKEHINGISGEEGNKEIQDNKDLIRDIYLTTPEIYTDNMKTIEELKAGYEKTSAPEIYSKVGYEYLEYADGKKDSGDYEEALNNYIQSMVYIPEDGAPVNHGNEALTDYVDSLMNDGDYEKVKDLQFIYANSFPGSNINEAISQIEELEAKQKEYYDYMQKIFDALDYENVAELQELFYAEETNNYFAEKDAQGKSCIYIPSDPLSDSGYGVEVYELDGRKILYLGDFVDGVREGSGKIFQDRQSFWNLGSCDWKNGSPNGYGYLYEASTGNYQAQYSGDLVDGKWDGHVSVTIDDYDNGNTYYMSFELSEGTPIGDVTQQYCDEYGYDISDFDGYKIYSYDGNEEKQWRLGASDGLSWGYPGYANIS